METANGNANSAMNTNNANLPPGFSASPIPITNSSTPGIPDANSGNMNKVQNGATPIPGIPDQKNLGKPLPKGTTPTPGIPDEKTRKEQMNNLSGNSKTEQKPPQTKSNTSNSQTD